MKIKILGTRGKIKTSAPKHARHSGVLIDNKILFDLGEQKYLRYKPSHIFITHLHEDHAVFMKKAIPKVKAKIYAPEKTDKLPKLKIAKTMKVGSYKITPIPTVHSLKVKSTAYLIEKNKQRILYTGDLIRIPKRYHNKIKNLDLVITDGSFIRKGGLVRYIARKIFGHAGIPDLVNFFKTCTKHIVFTHFGTWFYKDIKRSNEKIRSFSNDISVEASYDGKIIRL